MHVKWAGQSISKVSRNSTMEHIFMSFGLLECDTANCLQKLNFKVIKSYPIGSENLNQSKAKQSNHFDVENENSALNVIMIPLIVKRAALNRTMIKDRKHAPPLTPPSPPSTRNSNWYRKCFICSFIDYNYFLCVCLFVSLLHSN